jgi:hypothetical protein
MLLSVSRLTVNRLCWHTTGLPPEKHLPYPFCFRTRKEKFAVGNFFSGHLYHCFLLLQAPLHLLFMPLPLLTPQPNPDFSFPLKDSTLCLFPVFELKGDWLCWMFHEASLHPDTSSPSMSNSSPTIRGASFMKQDFTGHGKGSGWHSVW